MKLLLAFLIGLIMGSYPEVAYDVVMRISDLIDMYIVPKMVEFQ